MTTIVEMVSTGLYDEKALNKFYNRQLKLNSNNESIAEAMVRIYKHTFLIRTTKAVN